MINLSKVYFCSDTHFNHHNICRLSGRPFSSTEEMNLSLIKNINDLIQPNDLLYLLGDISFGKKNMVWYWLDQIKCHNIHYIRGNHCASQKYLSEENSIRRRLLSISKQIETKFLFQGRSYNFVLSHYPPEQSEIDDSKIYCCGHVHRHNPVIRWNVFDLGVDGHNMMPWSLEEVIKMYTKQRELKHG